MKHAVHHGLDDATAKDVAGQAFAAYATRYSEYEPRANWVSDHRCEISFRVKGISLRGVVALVPGAIEVDLEVPLVFRPFRKKAIARIEREIRSWIARAG